MQNKDSFISLGYKIKLYDRFIEIKIKTSCDHHDDTTVTIPVFLVNRFIPSSFVFLCTVQPFVKGNFTSLT